MGRPSKASIRAALISGVFDPRARTPMSIVVQLDDPSYCETKAVELISEAKIAIGGGSFRDSEEYHEKISQAMSLLALAKVQRGGTTQAKKSKEARGRHRQSHPELPA